MKRYILAAFIFILPLIVSAQGIQFFHGPYAKAQAEAKKQNKLIFIDCFTTWCGPCNRMSRDIFPRKDVGDYFNAHFICCKMDMEKGEGLDIAKNYHVNSYPTYLFLSGDGEMEHRALGSMTSELFIKEGQTANDPNENLQGLASRFVHGEHDTVMLHKLIVVTDEIEPDLHEKALAAYWKEVSDFRILEPVNWTIFKDYEDDIHSMAMNYVTQYRKDFNDKYGKKEVDDVLFGKAADALRTAADTKDASLFKDATDLMAGCQDTDVIITAGLNTLRYYRRTEDWKKYMAYSGPFLDKYGHTQEIFNSVSWEIVSNCEDQDLLKAALVYIDKSIALDKNYGNTDTKANVLYKLHMYREAKEEAVESIGLAKKEKLDSTSTRALLEKIEKELKKGK